MIITGKFYLSSANAFYMDQSKILPFGKECITVKLDTKQVIAALRLNHTVSIPLTCKNKQEMSLTLSQMTNFRCFQT